MECLAGAEMSYGKNYSQIFEGLSQGRGWNTSHEAPGNRTRPVCENTVMPTLTEQKRKLSHTLNFLKLESATI